jgi:DNA-binding MarR family transcriptional regulator
MSKNEREFPLQYYLRTVMHKIRLYANSSLEPYDISSQQARIVGFIGEKQEKEINVCQKDIEAVMGITGPSVTSLLQGLDRKGFIKRRRSTKDDRIKELTLTPKGKELIAKFQKVFDDAEKKIAQGMTNEQKALFIKLLKVIDDIFKK